MELVCINDLMLQDKPGRSWYFEKNNNTETLTITAGDSWTWGERLGKSTDQFDDFDFRTKHIYGYHLSQMIGSDFINIAVSGGNNFDILSKIQTVIDSLTKTYQHINIVFTLTESGRDLMGGFHTLRSHYNEWAGESWPKYQDVLSDTASHKSLELVLQETKNTLFGQHLNLYRLLHKQNTLIDMLTAYERYTFELLNAYFSKLSNTTWLIGRNFTSVFDVNKKFLPTNNLVPDRWVDIIAKNGDLSPYPDEVYVFSQLGWKPFKELTDFIDEEKFKSQWIDIIDKSLKAIDWFDVSPYNYRLTTRHPNEQAHQWWAEYLYKKLI